MINPRGDILVITPIHGIFIIAILFVIIRTFIKFGIPFLKYLLNAYTTKGTNKRLPSPGFAILVTVAVCVYVLAVHWALFHLIFTTPPDLVSLSEQTYYFKRMIGWFIVVVPISLVFVAYIGKLLIAIREVKHD